MDDLLLFVAVGFAAQLVDGAIGMAYGLTATTTLLSIGVPPAMASAAVHAAEVFTTGASGAAHWRFGNIDLALLRRLALPGMIGGALGAYVLSSVPGETVAPLVSAYLLGMGGLILWRALRQAPATGEPPKHLSLLGLGGGFLDAIGGGGWGPLVASTLVGQGTTPRFAIGSTNLATKLSNNGKLGDLGVIDSGIIEVLYVFGWVGSFFYLGGVLLALIAVRHGARRRRDGFDLAAGAIVAATFSASSSMIPSMLAQPCNSVYFDLSSGCPSFAAASDTDWSIASM